MGTPIKIVGWEGSIEGKLRLPVGVFYTYSKGEVKFELVLSAGDKEDLEQAIKLHAKSEMKKYMQQLRLANSSKDKAEPALRIIK